MANVNSWVAWATRYFEDNGRVVLKDDDHHEVGLVLKDDDHHEVGLVLSSEGLLRCGRYPPLNLRGMAVEIDDLHPSHYPSLLAALAERGEHRVSDTYRVLRYVVADVRAGKAPQASWTPRSPAVLEEEEEDDEDWEMTPEVVEANNRELEKIHEAMAIMAERGCTWNRACQLYSAGARPDRGYNEGCCPHENDENETGPETPGGA